MLASRFVSLRLSKEPVSIAMCVRYSKIEHHTTVHSCGPPPRQKEDSIR